MTVPAWTEVQLAVGGALRLACGDQRGLGLFDSSVEGFWRSFRAAALCYPLYLALLAFRIAGARWEAAGIPTVLIVETISYVIAWVAFPLLILTLTQWLHREHRFLPFIVAYNWSQIPQTVLFFVVGLDAASGLLPPSGAEFANIGAAVAALVYEWYIARVALQVTAPQAVLVVLADVALAEVLTRVASSLY